jgi:cytochrome c biogenesis protein CcmG, thiol:disulfide interchange protein DsbE
VSARTFVVFMAVLALIALLTFGLVSKGESALAVGEPIPDPELATLDGGTTSSIGDYRGDWVLINVWASWCDPCRDEAPELERFYREHRGDGFTVLGIDSRDVSGDARKFVDEFGLTYPQLHDSEGEVPDDLGMTGFPENFLVSPDGELALIQKGPVDREFLEQQVAPMIEAS